MGNFAVLSYVAGTGKERNGAAGAMSGKEPSEPIDSAVSWNDHSRQDEMGKETCQQPSQSASAAGSSSSSRRPKREASEFVCVKVSASMLAGDESVSGRKTTGQIVLFHKTRPGTNALLTP
ncbi:unnamed protein product [Protopolystoma xenopodis]|uniref:Uncharacterized protein n=1 Tax=Protopolystoma xenopodis TaxID=117903 RepID=A0A448XI33_9PLAT|nr:unnamed protein product [Protopolystoma xenopodis]